jgi:twitching motility protein PilU
MRELEVALPPLSNAVSDPAVARQERVGIGPLYDVVRQVLRALPTAVNIWLVEDEDVVVEDVEGLARLLLVDRKQLWRPTRATMRDFVDTLFSEGWERPMKSRALDVGATLTMDDWCRVNAGYVHEGRLQLVIRRHPATPMTLNDIGAPPELHTLIEEPRGLILFVGRTGAGKSTTMAASIGHINSRQSRHIIRIEDPHEIPVAPDRSLITVREVGRDVDSADLAVVDALRQGPDVICVSEVRTRATAEALFDAADAGHLCMATVHGANPVDALARFCGFFGSESATRAKLLSSVLLASIGQIRLPRIKGDGYIALFETLVAGEAGSPTRDLIAKCEWVALRERLNARKLDQSVPLAVSLARAVREGVVDRRRAELNAFDRSSFQLALEA